MSRILHGMRGPVCLANRQSSSTSSDSESESNSMARVTTSIVEAISFSSWRFSEMGGIAGGWVEIDRLRLVGRVPRTYENFLKIFAIAKMGQSKLPAYFGLA